MPEHDLSLEKTGGVEDPVSDFAASTSPEPNIPSEPFVSIVMPVYNAATTLADSIGSVLAQTSADFELICVDDGSTDGSAEVLDEYAKNDPRVRAISQVNRGVSVARNTGIDAARGRIVMFIDADDAYTPDAVETVAAAFGADPKLEALAFGAVCEPESAAPKHVRELLSPADARFDRNPDGSVDSLLFFGARAQPYAARAAFSLELLNREHLRFEPGLALAEDAALQIVAYSLAARTRTIPAKLYRYRMESASATHAYNAKASRERKMDQHLTAMGVIFRAWNDRDLAHFYLAPAIVWCMDLLLFDMVRVEEAEAVKVASRLSKLFAGAYGDDWLQQFKEAEAAADPKHASNRALLRVARSVDAASRSKHFQLGNIDLVRFFVATRGVKQCVERFV